MRCWWSKSLHPASSQASQPAQMSFCCCSCVLGSISFHFISFHFISFISFISFHIISFLSFQPIVNQINLCVLSISNIHFHFASIIHPSSIQLLKGMPWQLQQSLAAATEPHTHPEPRTSAAKPASCSGKGGLLERDMSLFHFSALEPSPAFGQSCQRSSSM